MTMLEGRNITLRLLAESDIDEYLKLLNNYREFGEYSPPRFLAPGLYRKEFAEKGYWAEDEGVMLITDKLGRILGVVVFFQGIKHEAGYEIGYAIFRREDRGKGYGTEALRIFSAYLFELKPIVRLHVKIVKGNIASRRIAEKCGYWLEGTFRRFGFCRGEYHDHEVLALLREDCPSLADALKS
jgi:ribosomal-protein-alanine N-acetyltransferase